MVTPARDREAIDQAIVRGSEQLKQGRLDLAQSSFREALALDNANIKVLALLGLTYFRGSQFAEARPIYEQLAELAPTDASHRLNLGLVYLKIGDGDRAISALEASRALDPSQGRAVSYLGLAYARAGRYAEAYRSFLLAGQNELASEIEVNLTPAERDQIQAQIGRTPTSPPPSRTATPRTAPPTPPPGFAEEPKRATAHTIPRTQSQQDGELATKAAAAMKGPPKSLGYGEVSSPEIVIEKADLRAPIEAPKLTDSQQFVLPAKQAVPEPVPGHSMVSIAVAAAAPATPAPLLTKAGGTPPRPLSELATEELVRPADSDEVFEIAPGGALIMRVTDKLMTRLAGVHVTGGDLTYEPATRRSRGHQTTERFDYGGTPLFAVSGDGYLVAAPGKKQFAAVLLDDDILYLREDLVFAFEGSLRWESGNVPGFRGKLPIVQFRGDGALVLRTVRPLVRVKLTTSGVVLVDAERIAGWIGRVIPRAVVPAENGPLGAMCIECTGEGIVLVEPAPDEPAPRVDTAPAPSPVTKQQPPPPPGSPVELEPDPDDEAKPAPDSDLAGFGDGFPEGDVEANIDRLDEI